LVDDKLSFFVVVLDASVLSTVEGIFVLMIVDIVVSDVLISVGGVDIAVLLTGKVSVVLLNVDWLVPSVLVTVIDDELIIVVVASDELSLSDGKLALM
jgi:hypothetical protein